MKITVQTTTGGTFVLTNAFILGSSIAGDNANGDLVVVPDSQIHTLIQH